MSKGFRLLVTVSVVLVVVGVLAAIVVGSGMLRALPAMLGQRPASTPGLSIAQPSVPAFAAPSPNTGVDVSFPQCQTALPEDGVSFAIVGLTGGRPAKDQPCLAEQWQWAQSLQAAAVYVNTEFIAGRSESAEPAALGRADAFDGLNRIASMGLPEALPVWLDVETENTWSGSQVQHVAYLSAMLATFAEAGHPVGIYSTPTLWRRITGGVEMDVPTWVAIGRNERSAAERTCSGRGLAGSPPAMVQWVELLPDGRLLDHDLICPSTPATGLLLPMRQLSVG